MTITKLLSKYALGAIAAHVFAVQSLNLVDPDEVPRLQAATSSAWVQAWPNVPLWNVVVVRWVKRLGSGSSPKSIAVAL